jgi:hypothetical protein
MRDVTGARPRRLPLFTIAGGSGKAAAGRRCKGKEPSGADAWTAIEIAKEAKGR